MLSNNPRIRALDVHQSFIVEAPAGSGKTSLLVNRYLKLLEHTRQPDQIYALTFTKKAANEMRHRIVNALQQSHQIPTQLRHDILRNPQILKIQTLDAFIQNLVKPQGELLDEDTLQLTYLEVVKRCLAEDPFTSLRIHLDNQTHLIEQFLVQLLNKREQWAYHLLPNNTDFFNQEIQNLKAEILHHLHRELKTSFLPFKKIWHELQTINDHLPPWMLNWLENTAIDHLTFQDLQNFAHFCLTKNYTVRKTWTKEQGFYTVNSKNQPLLKQLKQDLKALITPPLQPLLTEIILAPSPYSEYQNQILTELLRFLPRLLAHLQLYFQEHNVFDYVALTLKALDALEGDQQEFFLYRWTNHIQHLLIDEFQDTSWIHYRLINHLLTSFRENPAKTLFLVGDPMQSIYRFRGAEVGLFLKAKQNDLIAINALTLTENFRSSPVLINWFNQVFSPIFPETPVINLGAIPYTSSVATQSLSGTITVKFLKNGSLRDESETIWQILQTPAQGSRAILVRSRSHLFSLLNLLEERQYPYQGSELINLTENETVRDLISLIRSLFDLTDQLAWIALLRSTWCGLSAIDLAQINWDNDPNCWQLIQHTTLNDVNSQSRLNFLIVSLKPYVNQIRIMDWPTLIFKICLRLNPQPSTLEKKIAAQIFNCLPTQTELNLPLFLQKIKKRFISKLNTNSDVLQIMTIHKAKGLEFNEVIIPGMNQSSSPNEHELINWSERISERGINQLLVGIYDPTVPDQPTYTYLQYLNQTKNRYEQARLLYVGCTRAKNKLFLIGSGTKIKSNSFFGLLAPVWEQQWETEIAFPESEEHQQPTHLRPMRYQFVPPLPEKINGFKRWEYQWSFEPENARCIGLLIHHLLYEIATHGFNYLTQQSNRYWEHLTHTFHLDFQKIEALRQQLLTNLRTNIAQWILKPRPEQHQEWKISNGKQLFVVDRCFKENDTWWIIDYKTTAVHQIPLLLDQYRLQLFTYQRILKPSFNKIRLGLFFPLVPSWQEIT